MADLNLSTADTSLLRASPSAGDPAGKVPHSVGAVKDADGNAVPIDVAHPLAVRQSDGADWVAPALESGGNLAATATALGAPADAAATNDTGTFAVIPLLKRWLSQFTTFLDRFPAALSSDGGIKGTLVTKLPAGDQLVGKVGVQGGGNDLSIDSAGAVAIQSGGTPGSAAPTRAVMVGGSDGTNLRAVKTAADGTVRVDPTGTTAQPGYGLWSGLTAGVSLFDDLGTNPTIKALANGSLQVATAVVDNTAGLYPWLDLDLLVRGASAFTAGGTVDVWVLTTLDGTTYEDGSASVTPGRPPDGYFYLRAVSTAQRLTLAGIQLPPCKCKVLLRNSGGVAFTNTNSENALTYYRHGG